MSTPSASSRGDAAPLGATTVSLAVLTAALWGGTPVAVSFAVEWLPPVRVAAVRFAMAAVFMLLWCRFERTPIRVPPAQMRMALVVAVLLFLQISTFNVGIVWSNSSHAAMLINTFVFWVAAIEHFITKQDRLTTRKLCGLVSAMLGVVVVLSATNDVGGAAASDPSDAPTLAGDAVLVGSAILLALRIIYVKRAVHHMEPSQLMFWHAVFGVFMFAVYSAAAETAGAGPVSAAAVLGLVYQGVVVAGLCFAVQSRLLREHSASRIAVFSFATPLFGVLIAVVLRDDPLSPWLILSVACVATGIYLVNSGSRRAA